MLNKGDCMKKEYWITLDTPILYKLANRAKKDTIIGFKTLKLLAILINNGIVDGVLVKSKFGVHSWTGQDDCFYDFEQSYEPVDKELK